MGHECFVGIKLVERERENVVRKNGARVFCGYKIGRERERERERESVVSETVM